MFKKSTTLLVSLFSISVWAQNQGTPLDKTLAPPVDDSVNSVFQDMAVVQRRAMVKGGKFILSNYGSLDFSDGPYSMYGFNINPGYAISDFWEVYANFVPFFLNNKRSIVEKVEALRPTSGERYSIDSSHPKIQYGLEVLWAPAYGKDSVGTSRVIRSDTFFKLGVSQIKFEDGTNGMKFGLAVGKTYFFAKWLGFRIAASGNFIQTAVASDGQSLATAPKTFKFFGIVEAGLMFYL